VSGLLLRFLIDGVCGVRDDWLVVRRYVDGLTSILHRICACLTVLPLSCIGLTTVWRLSCFGLTAVLRGFGRCRGDLRKGRAENCMDDCGLFRLMFAYTDAMFNIPTSRCCDFTIRCKGCGENVQAPVQTLPDTWIVGECPLCGARRRYLPAEIFRGTLSYKVRPNHVRPQ
jgi:hypothetical protein